MMNTNNRIPHNPVDTHNDPGFDPDPAFVDRLESQLVEAMRDRSRFSLKQRLRGSRRIGWRAAAMFTILCLASMSLGAAGAIAVTSKPSHDFELLRLRAEAAVRIAEVARNAATERVAHIEPLVDAGYASSRELQERQMALAESEAQMRLRTSELEETLLRQAAFDDSIAASTPLGRDFVTNRLKIRLDLVQQQVDVLAQNTNRMEAAVKAGRAPQSDVRAASQALERAAAEANLLKSLIELRNRVIENDILHEQAELEAMRLEHATLLREAELKLDAAVVKQERTRTLAETALASDRQLRDLTRELEVARIERDTLRSQLGIIEEMIAERAGSHNDSDE